MLLVHLEKPSPRARYIVRHIFERMLGWPVAFASSAEEFRVAGGPKLSYGNAAFVDAFHVPSSGRLEEKSTRGIDPPQARRNDGLVLFAIGDDFDVFAATFFFLSLTEEYRTGAKDAHGRFPAEQLWAVKNKMERTPFVDRWALDLADRIRANWPSLPAPERVFKHWLTVDVDNGLKFAGRPLHRAVGASAKDLLRGDMAGLAQRWRVRSGVVDPYTAFVLSLKEAKPLADRVIAFVLMDGRGAFNHAASVDHPAYRALLTDLARHADIGLHPSYESSERPGLFASERDKLRSIIAHDIMLSRQHFLRWKLPSTLRALLDLGFTEDHSIGFSDRVGFRAGTCTPFPFYDLEREEETSLMLVPFATMDSALREKQGADIDNALMEMKRACDAVRAVSGTFVSVWHDRYLSGHGEFKRGPEAMMELVRYASR